MVIIRLGPLAATAIAVPPPLVLEWGMVLESAAQPSPEAWAHRPHPWPVRQWRDGTLSAEGEVMHDRLLGWTMRLFAAGEDPADVPIHRLRLPTPLRPGTVVRITAPEGVETSWRVLAVGAPA